MGKFKRRRYAVSLLCDDNVCKKFNAEVYEEVSVRGLEAGKVSTSKWR